jgi:4-hydroxy-tetrahydrodipicolinate synthase
MEADDLNWSGIWIPLVTPFCDGRVDHPSLARLVHHLAAQGVAGFVACGSTGEAAMLAPDEQDAVLATALAAAQGLPVLMGIAGTRPDAVAARACELAGQHAVAGFLLAAPAYVRPSQSGIAHYFEQIASAATRPIVAYDVPARTGVRIEPATMLALAAHPNIQAIKDCSGDRAAAEAVLSDGRLALLAGNDDELFDQLARGAIGGITASAQAAPAAFVALHRLLANGQLGAARDLWRRAWPLTRALFAEPNPAPLKALLARQGWLDNTLRAPMQAASRQLDQALDAALSRL